MITRREVLLLLVGVEFVPVGGGASVYYPEDSLIELATISESLKNQLVAGGKATVIYADSIPITDGASLRGLFELLDEATEFGEGDFAVGLQDAELKRLPASLVGGEGGGSQAVEFMIALSDLTTALATGTNKAYFRMPFAMTVTEVRASVLTAPTGSILIVDINEGGITILSTKLSIDATEKTSETAASAAVISDANLADDAEIGFDIDQVGSTVAGAGLIVTLIGTRV